MEQTAQHQYQRHRKTHVSVGFCWLHIDGGSIENCHNNIFNKQEDTTVFPFNSQHVILKKITENVL